MAVGLRPRALASLGLTLPIQVLSQPAEQTLQAVIEGRVDLAITSLPLEQKNIHCHWIGQSRCVAVLNGDDPLAGQSVLKLSALTERLIIIPYNPYRLRDRFDKALKNMTSRRNG